MPNLRVAATDAVRFYRVGALGLRALEDLGLGAARFSTDALARWKAFCGELTDSHRLDLLLRDGAVMYPLAFSARSVFALPGLAHDEPFGPEWDPLAPAQAGVILREALSVGRADSISTEERLRAWADAWSLELSEPDPAHLADVKAASRLVVAGAGALIGLAGQMAGRSDCDFGDQVLFVTEQPGLRQLAGLAAAITGSRKSPRLVLPGAAPDATFGRATGVLVSADASAAAAASARAVASALGA